MKQSFIFVIVLFLLTGSEKSKPRVLIIGDSISIHYTPFVQEILEGEAVVVHNPGNARYTGKGLADIDEWLGDGQWDVIHFNWGLWDLYGWKYMDSLRTPETYAANLEILVQRLEKTGAKLIWGTTTPVCPGPEVKAKIIVEPETQLAFRKAALEVMRKHEIQVNDLYAKIHPHLEDYSLGENDVHYNPAGYEFLGEKVSESIMDILYKPEIHVSTGYTPPDSYLNPKNRIEIGSDGYSAGDFDDSKVFQKAIDDVHAAGGGHVVVPQGEYHIMDIQMKSDVHIIFLNGAIVHPCMEVLKWDKGEKENQDRVLDVEEVYRSGNLFNFGMDDRIKNVSLIGSNGGTSIDFSKVSTGMRAVYLGDCMNFRIANLSVQDNQSIFSAIILSWGGAKKEGKYEYAGLAWSGVADHNPGFPVNGLIENIKEFNSHYGYGAIQAHSGTNIRFLNIESEGGVAVRLETGIKELNLSRLGGLFNIEVEHVISRKGQGAVFFQPHTMIHGEVVARDITSYGSEFAVVVESPFVSERKYGKNSHLEPGLFRSITIDGVKAVYEDGPIITRTAHLRYYPEELHGELKRINYERGRDFHGPSIVAVAVVGREDQIVSISNVEPVGFKYHPGIITKDDLYKGSMEHLTSMVPEKYEANWESLRTWENPQWSLDAKFGIYAHWGPYTQSGAWRDNPNINWGNYYCTVFQGIYNTDSTEARRLTFEKRYGSITEGNGYRDLCETFSADGYDASDLADLIERSGAHYAGICAIHHDGYAMWDSDVTPHCAGKTGPKRDLLGDILSELKERDIKTIASFHHARTYHQFNGRVNGFKKAGIEGVDISDPQNHDYYWFLGTMDRFIRNRKALTYEVIDKYHPDMLWFDGGGGNFQTEEILAYYFNSALDNRQEVALHNKGNFGENFGIYSYENGAHRPGFVEWPWSDDTPSAVGWCDWPWWYGLEYKKPRDVVVRLADLVARNGGLLLSLNPRPDGSLDKEQIELLEGIGSWLKQNDEAIYGTRPWIIYAEGHVEPIFWQDVDCPYPGKNFGKEARPIQPDTKQFDESDIRFTVKGNVLYAIQLDIPPGKKTIIKSLGRGTEISSVDKIQSIELLGYGKVKFKREADKLEIDLPEQMPNNYAPVFKIEVKGDLIQRPQPDPDEIVSRLPEQL